MITNKIVHTQTADGKRNGTDKKGNKSAVGTSKVSKDKQTT